MYELSEIINNAPKVAEQAQQETWALGHPVIGWDYEKKLVTKTYPDGRVEYVEPLDNDA